MYKKTNALIPLSMVFENQFRLRPPEGRPGMSDVTLLSGISRLLFDCPYLSPLLIFLPSPLALAVLSFFCYWSILLTFFLQKTLKYFSLRVRLFCYALVEQLGDDRW